MKAVRFIVRFIFGILLLLSVVLATLSFSFSTLTDTTALADELADEDLTNMVCEAIREEIEVKTMLFQLGSDTFYDSVSESELVALTRGFMKNLVEHYILGKNLEMPYFESQALRDEIEKDLNEYAQLNNLEVEEGSVDEIYNVYCGVASSKCAIVAKSYLEALPTFEKYIPYLDYEGYACLAGVLCIALIILVDIKKPLSGLYSSLAFIWTGAALVFIPLYAFSLYDLPSRIAIGRSPLKELVRNLVDAVLSRGITGSLIVLAVATFLLIIVISATVVSDAKKAKSRHRHSRHGHHSHSHHSHHDESRPSNETEGVFGITEKDIEG